MGFWDYFKERAKKTINNQVDNFRVGAQPIQRFIKENPTPASFANKRVIQPTVRLNNTIQQSQPVRIARKINDTMTGVEATRQLGRTVRENAVVPFARSTGNIANTLMGNKQFKPEGAQKFFYGDAPVGNVQDRFTANKQLIEQNKYLPIKNKGASTALALAGTGLAMVGDLTPVGGGEKGVAKILTKVDDATKVRGILKGINLSDEAADAIAKSKNALEIDNIIKTAKTAPTPKLSQGADALSNEARKYKSAEDYLKKTLPENKIESTRGWLTTDGKSLDLETGQHPLMLKEAGLQGGSVDKFTEAGNIRLRNTIGGDGIGQQNIQIGAKPTQEQVNALTKLSDKSPIYFDFKDGQRTLSSPVEGSTKQDFIKQLNDFYNKSQPLSPQSTQGATPKINIDERLAPIADKDGTVTVYRAAAKFPDGKLPKETFVATDPNNARYYAESHYNGDPSDITIRSYKIPASKLKRGGSNDAWQLNEDFSTQGAKTTLTNAEIRQGIADGLLDPRTPLNTKKSPTGTPTRLPVLETATPQTEGKLPVSSKQKIRNTAASSDMAAQGKIAQQQLPEQPTSGLGQPEIVTNQSFDPTIPQSGEKSRSFQQTVRKSSVTSPELRAKVEDDLYQVRNTQELAIKAKNLVKNNIDVARDIVATRTDDKAVAVGQELIKKLQETPEGLDEAVDVANNVARILTESGRTSQAASMYLSLTPDGILRFAQKEINKMNVADPTLKVSLDSKKAQKLVDMSKKIQSMAEGDDKVFETQKLLKEVHDIFPPAWTSKVATFQTMMQLLNPKTMIRNVAGNEAFRALENTSQTVATPLDAFLSLFTGKRTTSLPNIVTQAKGQLKGLKQGYRDAVAGVNTSGKTQFDLPETQVFRDKLLGTMEKAMNVALRATDRANYVAAFDDSIRMQLKLNKATEVTSEMIEQAHLMGLYRTFQDTNALTKLFSGLKKVLNNIGLEHRGQRFGLGDLILKYPKTPANLLARGIDYSPAGFVKAIYEMAKPLFGKPFDQKAFVDSVSRASVGTTGLVGTGMILGSLGLITEAPSKDKDVRGIQKTQGQGGYQFNVSGLKRFVASGFNAEAAKLKEGDTLVSYDWMQPAAIGLSMGAKIATKKNAKDAAGGALDSLAGGVETLAEQPLVRGVRDVAQGNKPLTDVVVDTLKDAPPSFTSSLINQVGQVTDNTTRETYDPRAAKESYNKVKARIPFARETLPERINVLGQTQETYQSGSNNLFNVFLNPAFINKYKPNDTASEVLNLMKSTGSTSQMPRVVDRKITITDSEGNKQTLELNQGQINEYQKYVGDKTNAIIQEVQNNPIYQGLGEEEKVKQITSLLSDVGTAAKIQLFGHTPSTKDGGASAVLNGSYKLSGGSGSSLPRITLKKASSKKGRKIKVKSAPKFKNISKPKVAKEYKLKIKRAA